jgi:hypothetical protein
LFETSEVEIGEATPANLIGWTMYGPNGTIDIGTYSISVPSVAADDSSAITKDTVYDMNRFKVAWGELGQKPGWLAWGDDLDICRAGLLGTLNR